MVIKIINQNACKYLAQDVLSLPDKVLEENFWEIYQQWQNFAEGPLHKLWKGHEEDHVIGVVFELHDFLGLEWGDFQGMSVEELKRLLPIDGKFQQAPQKLAA